MNVHSDIQQDGGYEAKEGYGGKLWAALRNRLATFALLPTSGLDVAFMLAWHAIAVAAHLPSAQLDPVW
jgi:hypothetical protein